MLSELLLDVPYFIQPTSNTCQSTCLKMYANYLQAKTRSSNPAAAMSITQIWNAINTGNRRPVNQRNSYRNMVWWLNEYFRPDVYSTRQTSNVEEAISLTVKSLSNGYPVMVSTNHRRTSGHIILVIGYKGYQKGYNNPDIKFVCHDPYGKFDPQLNSNVYGKRRFKGQGSAPSGGEIGPGMSVLYDYQGIRRIRTDRHSRDIFYLLSAH